MKSYNLLASFINNIHIPLYAYPAWLKNDSYSNWWSHKNFTHIKWVSYITNKVVGSLKCVLFIIMLFEVYIVYMSRFYS